jgi:AcrR family transcriptional regulator
VISVVQEAGRGRSRPGGGYAPEETRRELMESALTLFGAQGFAGTSVQEITTGAGVTKGAFYHHFDSKEDLLRLIHDQFVDYQLEAMGRVMGQDLAPLAQIEEVLREFLESVERFQANVTVFFQERRYLTGDRFQAIMEKRDRFDRMFLDIIEQGVRTGDFRKDLDPRIVGLGLLGMCAWTYQWFRPGGKRSSSDIAAIFSTLVLDGLRTR